MLGQNWQAPAWHGGACRFLGPSLMWRPALPSPFLLPPTPLPAIHQVPLGLRLGPLTAISCGLAQLSRMGKGSAYKPSRLPEQPLVYWCVPRRLRGRLRSHGCAVLRTGAAGHARPLAFGAGWAGR